jgi:pyruvate dehydrogenase (quinone)
MKTVADQFVETLAAAGVKRIYGVVGDSLNGKLGFIDIENKAAGMEPVFTDLKNPNFGEVARAMGLWGHMVSKAGDLEEAVRTWLAQPGPAVLDVKVKPMELVTPPSPFVSPEAVVGMAVYSAKAMLHGHGHDVWEMIVENIP